MEKSLVLLPAYGKQYKDAEECLKDWNAGRDFQICGGPYCSDRDIPSIKADGYTDLLFGRHNGTFITRITFKE